MHSYYEDPRHVAKAIEANRHREFIGGMWEEMGSLQLNFLIANGMEPRHRLLDIGCGSLRLGSKAVAYLDPGNYWGTDLNPGLMNAGYDKEIVAAGLGARLSPAQLIGDPDFTFGGVPRNIDFAMANSVFTHLPLNHIRVCLHRLSEAAEPGLKFFFTVFTPAGPVWESSRQPVGGKLTHPHKDPYHVLPDDVMRMAAGLPWDMAFIGDWSHPRNQKIFRATLRER